MHRAKSSFGTINQHTHIRTVSKSIMDYFDEFDARKSGVWVEILRQSKCPSPESDATTLHHMAFDHLKLLKDSEKFVKCTDGPIGEHIEQITASHAIAETPEVAFDDITFYVYSVVDNAAEAETLETGNDGLDDVPASNHWLLPHREFEGQWEHLYYDDEIKENLLRFAKSIMLFSQKKVDRNAVSCNKLLFLHGPPGTGKTTLCKALAHKLSIQLSGRYQHTHLFEINSHSLFSKWFSESGKLVLKLFTGIREVAEDPNSLVTILIDEVESITFARNALSSAEPSDSMRVVNAVLTQIDQLQRYPNVLILTTSNLSESIDSAFVDRADLKQYIDNPSPVAIFHILKSAIVELIKAKVVCENEDGRWKSDNVDKLLALVKKCHGLSGRSLRKLPLLAHAWFIQHDPSSIQQFLNALQRAITKHVDDNDCIGKHAKRANHI